MGTTASEATLSTPNARMTAAQIARDVIDRLESGEFAPGQRLVEADLCLRYASGRQIIREALQHLNALGIVALKPNRGAHIVHVSREDAIMTLELTELLFGLVSRSAARSIAAGADASWLDAAIDELMQSSRSDDRALYMRARRHLFGALSHIAGNAELSRIMDQVRVHAMRAQFGFADFRKGHAQELAEIGRTVIAGDSANADEHARKYVRSIREALQQL